MSGFTIFVVIVIVAAAALGWRAGLLKQVGGIAGVVLGIAACRMFGDLAARILGAGSPGTADSMLRTVLAYILLFIIVYALCRALAHLMRGLLGAIHIGILNHLGGAVFKAAEWMFLLSLLLNLWCSFAPVTSMEGDPVFDRVLWFGPYLMGTEAAEKFGQVVSAALGG